MKFFMKKRIFAALALALMMVGVLSSVSFARCGGGGRGGYGAANSGAGMRSGYAYADAAQQAPAQDGTGYGYCYQNGYCTQNGYCYQNGAGCARYQQ